MARYPDSIDIGAVRLERFRSAMAEEMCALVNANFYRLHFWMPWAAELPTVDTQRKALEDMEQKFESDTDFGYAVIDTSSGEIIGGTGLHLRAGPDTREIGYWIAASHEGRGLVGWIVETLASVAFSEPGVSRVEIRCDEANIRSAAVAVRAGFTLDQICEREPVAPAETGRQMVWVQLRDL